MSEEIIINCPICNAQTIYSPANEHRPFCSDKCRQIDLGAWAASDYSIEVPLTAEDIADNEELLEKLLTDEEL